MDFQHAFKKLGSINQSHLLDGYGELTLEQQNRLLAQIDQINLETFKLQQQLLRSSESQILQDILPFPPPPSSGNQIDFAAGKTLVAQGLMGCLIVAGGQGTRLHFEGPKGMFPVTQHEHKSLFQLFAEKVAAAGRQAKRTLPLAIMTSPNNHQETIAFFQEHHFFGLDSQQVSFFSQSTLPLLDKSGNLFLESKDTLAVGPDGNGLALHHFFYSGLWSIWYQQGVRALNFIVIDNPLADPFDAELLGYHQRCHNDITVKCVLRKHAREKVGVLAQQAGNGDEAQVGRSKKKTVIVEYSELPESLADLVQSDGSLMFSYANISYCFSLDFIKKSVQNSLSMPLHKAFKAASYLDSSGHTQRAIKPIAWKFETFIFDLLPMAEKVGALLYPRDQCFSPLKNYEGDDSIETVRHALQNNDRRVFEEVTGEPYNEARGDISQDFYYPTPELLKKRNVNA